MVNIAQEITLLPPTADGYRYREVGPTGRAVSNEHSTRFATELARLADQEERITVNTKDYGSIAVFVDQTDKTSDWNYWVHSVVGMDPDVPETDLWTSSTTVSFVSETAGYTVLNESKKVGVYRNPEFCAALVIAAIRAHMAAGESRLPVTEQYTRGTLDMLAGARRF